MRGEDANPCTDKRQRAIMVRSRDRSMTAAVARRPQGIPVPAPPPQENDPGPDDDGMTPWDVQVLTGCLAREMVAMGGLEPPTPAL